MTSGFAADGFPIDRSLERRARHAACGFAALGTAYLLMLLHRLAELEGDSAAAIAHAFAERAAFFLEQALRAVSHLLLALAAWQAISMRRWTSAATVASAGVLTLWALAWIALAAWRTYRPAQSVGPWPGLGLAVLTLAQLCCFELLRRAVGAYNARRYRVLSERAGRIGAAGPLSR